MLHAGDATINGTIDEIKNFNRWFVGLPHKIKIFVAGNHDWLFERNNSHARQLLDDSIIYLQDSSIKIEDLRIYGSPWQPRFFDWAFNLNRGTQLEEKWKMIPLETDILITTDRQTEFWTKFREDIGSKIRAAKNCAGVLKHSPNSGSQSSSFRTYSLRLWASRTFRR